MNSSLLRIIRVAVAGIVSSLIVTLIPVINGINITIGGVVIPLAVIIPAALLNGIGKWVREKWGMNEEALVNKLPI